MNTAELKIYGNFRPWARRLLYVWPLTTRSTAAWVGTNHATIQSIKRVVLRIAVKLASNASYVNEPPNGKFWR